MSMYGTLPTSTSTESSGLEFISRAKEGVRSGLGTRRPWKEMSTHDLHSFGIPSNFTQAISRVRNNLAYFRMNYAIIVLVIVFLSLLWQPISLIVFMVMLTVWIFLYFLRDEPLVIGHRVIDDRVVLIVLFIVTIVVLLFSTHATYNIVISVSVGVVVVLIHSLFRKTEDLFVDEEDLEHRPFHAATTTPTTTTTVV